MGRCFSFVEVLQKDGIKDILCSLTGSGTDLLKNRILLCIITSKTFSLINTILRYQTVIKAFEGLVIFRAI